MSHTEPSQVSSAIRQMPLEDFKAALLAQGVDREDYAFKCPVCRTVQSAADLIAAGAGKDFSEVERYLGFACLGRFTGAGAARKQPDGNPCDWTLGGLLRLNTFEVVTPDGKGHPHFEPASAEEAQAHAAVKSVSGASVAGAA